MDISVRLQPDPPRGDASHHPTPAGVELWLSSAQGVLNRQRMQPFAPVGYRIAPDWAIHRRAAHNDSSNYCRFFVVPVSERIRGLKCERLV